MKEKETLMYIEKFKNNGTDYLRIMQSTYDKTLGKQRKKVIKNLGPLSRFDDGEADFLERLRETFRQGEIELGGIRVDVTPTYKMTFQTNDTHEIVMKNMGYFILEKFYKDLEIDKVLQLEKSRSKIEFDVNGLTKLLVLGRILKPESKKRTFEKRHDYLFPITSEAHEHEIYRTLDVLHKKSEAIQLRMNTKIKQSSIGRHTELMYYDVTNYYFETLYNDDDVYQLDEAGNPVLGVDGKPIILEVGLRKKGVSKEKRKTPLVAMGLFIDQNGIPVSYHTFAGNIQDKTTFKEMIKSSLGKHELGKVVVVADNGNHAQENLYLLVTKGNGYVVSKSVKQKWNVKSHKELTKLGDWINDESGYDHNYNKQGILTFKSKSRIYERKLDDKEGNSVIIKEKEVVFWSQGHYQKQLKENSKFIEYLESCIEHPDKLRDKQRKSQEFIKVYQTDPKTGEILKTKPVVELLTKKIEKQKEIMGWYCIVTSEVDKSDTDIINSYHRLSRIEDSFRVLKSNMEARPIYLWNKKRINAHFLICFISLTIIRLLQHHVLKDQGKDTFSLDGWEQGMTTECIQEALNQHTVATDDHGVCLFNKITDELTLIYKALGIDYRLERPTVDAINKFKHSINKMKFI